MITETERKKTAISQIYPVKSSNSHTDRFLIHNFIQVPLQLPPRKKNSAFNRT